MDNVLGVVSRSDKVAFYGIADTDGKVTYHRMRGFTEISTSKNPKEYSRQYVDETTERTDVIGYATSIGYNFDEIEGNEVHSDLVKIEEDELVGSAAVREILIVYLNREAAAEGTFEARKRSFAVVPDSSGDSTDAMTHSGTFKANGETVVGTATTTDGWQTATFTTEEV